MTIASKLTTAIGSLPHHNVDAALQLSFKLGIPFLPQIPSRNPWEFMIAQALEGLPGLEVSPDGAVILDASVWKGCAKQFNERLLNLFENEYASLSAFESFEPSSAASSSWQPFLWECEERGTKLAKVQLGGPLAAQSAIRLKSGGHLDRLPELASQIFRLVLARALSMTRKLKQAGIEPLIFLDEPGLYGFSNQQPRQVLAMQELRLLIQTLKKDGAIVGLHCCSNTDWNAVLGLGLDFLSIDTELSLKPLLSNARESLQTFLDAGGCFSLGVIPTQKAEGVALPLDPARLLHDLKQSFELLGGFRADQTRTILNQSLLSPACGLALHTPSDAEKILEALLEFGRLVLQEAHL